MAEKNLGGTFIWWVGIVVDVNDPNTSGRVKVRVFGRHDDVANIPDSSLPWAQVMQPVTSAAIGRIGSSPVGLVKNSRVIGFWADGNDNQYPVIIGTIGKAGDVIPGSMINGVPEINPNSGSIPQGTIGFPQSSQTILNPGRETAAAISNGTVNIEAVTANTGVVATTAVRQYLAFPTLPTIGSADKDDTSDVLDICKAVDPMSTISALPCFNNNMISIRSILSMIGGMLGNAIDGMISSLASMVINAIQKAILALAQKLGIFKILGMLNQVVAGAKDILNIINSLNIAVCGSNIINQGLFDSVNFAIGSVIGGLNNIIGGITGGINTVIDTTTGLVNSAANALSDNVTSSINNIIKSSVTLPDSNMATETSPKPLSNVVITPPSTYVQQYYDIKNDPFPGYIVWKDSTGTNDPVYTLRNGEPNFSDAKAHTEYAAQNHFTSIIGSSIMSGNLSLNTLMSAVSSTTSFAQGFALAKTLGAGFNIANAAGLASSIIPIIAGNVQRIFQTKITTSIISESVSEPVNKFMQAQMALKLQRDNMRIALSNIETGAAGI